MSVDSAVTNYFDPREYETGKKVYEFQGIGCVAAWGTRFGKFGQYLHDAKIKKGSHTLTDISSLVKQFLTEEIRPHEKDIGDIGYQISGFGADGDPQFHQLAWTYQNRIPKKGEKREYIDYTPEHELDKSHTFSYDGKFDTANNLVNAYIDELKSDSEVRYDRSSSVGVIEINDFVVRFVGELTKEVGPPFYHLLISPDNRIRRMTNETFCKLDRDKINETIWEMGYIEIRLDEKGREIK